MIKQYEPEELKILRRIEEILRTIARQQLSPVFTEHVSTPELKQLYELTGIETIDNLVKKTGLSAGTISNTWKRWEKVGLLKKDGKRYRKVI